MKVGIFTDTYKPQINGVVTSVTLTEKVLRENGHEPYIFTITHPECDPQNDPENVFRIPSVRFWGNKEHRIGLLYSPMASKKAKELGIELIHSHAPFSLGFFGHISAKKLGVPEVHTYHTMLEDYVHYLAVSKLIPSQFAQKYSKIFCNMVDGVIVPTPKVYDKLESYGVTTPMFTLPTGIDLTNFRKEFCPDQCLELRRQYGLSADDKILIFVGRIAKEKNIEKLITYHQKLVEIDSQYKLVIVGSGDYIDDLRLLTKQRMLEDAVIFTGKKDYKELPYYYNMADCFVIASDTETQGLVVVEAMATGLPVIAFDDDSFYPMVKKDVNGYYFTTEDEYIDRVLCLNRDQAIKEKFTQKSIEISEEFSADRFYEKLINIYETILNNQRIAK